MSRFDTELLGLPIVSKEDASVLGEVDGLIVDDSGLRVAGFLVNLGLYEAKVLRFGKALAIGADAVIVESADSLNLISKDPELEKLALKEISVTEAAAITVSGRSAGVLGDFLVDTESGGITGVELIGSTLSLTPEEPALIAAACIERLGPDIAVLKDDFEGHMLSAGPAGTRSTGSGPQGEAVNGAPREIPSPPEPEPLFVAQEESSHDTIEPGTLVDGGPEADADTAEAPKHFLLGKRVLRRLEDPQGRVLAEKGDLVDQEMIVRAKQSEMLLILSLNVE